MAVIYVQNKDGKPLMPTTRGGHVRHLLKTNQARVVERYPFTIRLLYDTEGVTQPLYLGIDPGRTNIGVTVVREDGEAVFSAQLETRNKEVPKLMAARKAYRQAHRKLNRRDKRRRRARAAGTAAAPIIKRRLPGCEELIQCHDIRNKEARFNNRRRTDGWLTPTANYLLQTHLNLIAKLRRYLPITDVVLEINRFAFMAMDNPRIKRWQYSKGPLHGYGSVKDAVFEMQNGQCLFCKNDIEHYHHVVPRHCGGSETLENRVGLCQKHHDLVHKNPTWTAKLATKKTGLNKKHHALSVLNQIIPYLLNELATRFPGHVYATTGAETAAYRQQHNIPKDHHLDAYCIACSVANPKAMRIRNIAPYRIKQFRRHDRQACHQQMLDRKYYLDGKLVAVNRHKATEQKNDSLEEFRASLEDLSAAEIAYVISHLQVLPHHARYKDMLRPMPGSAFIHNGKYHVLQGSQGRNNGSPNYFIDTSGLRHPARQCIFVLQNAGLQFIA